MRNPNSVLIPASVARRMPKPVSRAGRPALGMEAAPVYDRNRKAIAKLRQRGFSVGQIHRVLKSFGINYSYHSFYMWYNQNMRNTH